MINKCKYFTIRKRQNMYYFFCRLLKQQVTLDCYKNCQELELKRNKTIKNKTNKLKKLEANRYSILTDDLKHCYLCGKKKMDTHELIGGCNRQMSMKWGLTIPICRECHDRFKTDIAFRKELEILAQKEFEKKYNHELFMSEFKKNYL